MPAKHQPDCALLKASNSKNTLSNTEPKNIDANDNKAATLKNTKSSSADPFSSVPSLHRLLIDKIPAKVCRVRFFANGDRFFSGLSYVVNLERIRTLDLLCADLSRLLVNLVSFVIHFCRCFPHLDIVDAQNTFTSLEHTLGCPSHNVISHAHRVETLRSRTLTFCISTLKMQ